MKKTISLALTLLIVPFFLAQNLSATQKGIRVSSLSGEKFYLYKDYYALVVGIGDYDYWPDLQGAVKDAKVVAEYLKIAGMKVSLVLNPNSKDLKKAMNRLTYEIGREKDRAILFFYSGHGETETLATEEKLGYIIPKDCPTITQDYMGFTEKAISMNQIETYALRIRSKHVLMVFDSCFSGSVFASLKGVPTDISEKSNRPVRQFITAGNENEQVPDESVFKTCFIQGLDGEADYNKDGYVTGSELGMYLDTSVVNYSRGAQHPQYGKIRHPKLDKGDFVFAKSGTGELAFYKRKAERLEQEIEKLRQQLERAELERLKEKSETKKFETERQKTEIASLPQTQAYSPPSNRRSKIKLAVFSGKMAPSNMYVNEVSVVSALIKELSDNVNYFVQFSYYDLGEKIKAKKINDKIVPQNIIKEMWKRDNLFSEYKPNLDLICEIGQELKVDAILTFKVPSTSRRGSLYLIDVNKKQLFEETGDTGAYGTRLDEFTRAGLNKFYKSYFQ